MSNTARMAASLREIARGVYITNAIRAGQIDNIAAELERAASADEVLSQVDDLLQTMIISAEVFTDAQGAVTGYKIKTGALHKIVGLRTHLFFPQQMKEAQ